VSLALVIIAQSGGFVRDRTGSSNCVSNNGFCPDWIVNNLDRYWTPLLQHVYLVVVSVSIGVAIAFSLGLLAHRKRWLIGPLTGVTGALYTIPSIAFFFLLLPITGIGKDTAIVALAVYTLQIIYRNMMLGLDNVPISAKEAARGMGYTDRQILWKVELPLAIPEIVAGLRVAVVSTIAIATLAVFIGGGGLGTQIYGGGNLTFPTSVFIALAIVLLMAMVFHVGLLLAQRFLTPWRKVRSI